MLFEVDCITISTWNETELTAGSAPLRHGFLAARESFYRPLSVSNFPSGSKSPWVKWETSTAICLLFVPHSGIHLKAAYFVLVVASSPSSISAFTFCFFFVLYHLCLFCNPCELHGKFLIQWSLTLRVSCYLGSITSNQVLSHTLGDLSQNLRIFRFLVQ